MTSNWQLTKDVIQTVIFDPRGWAALLGSAAALVVLEPWQGQLINNGIEATEDGAGKKALETDEDGKTGEEKDEGWEIIEKDG